MCLCVSVCILTISMYAYCRDYNTVIKIFKSLNIHVMAFHGIACMYASSRSIPTKKQYKLFCNTISSFHTMRICIGMCVSDINNY